MPIGKHTQMSLEIVRLDSQDGGGKRKCGVCIRQRLFIKFLKGNWRLIGTCIILVLHIHLGHHIRTEGEGAASGHHAAKIQQIAQWSAALPLA